MSKQIKEKETDKKQKNRLMNQPVKILKKKKKYSKMEQKAKNYKQMTNVLGGNNERSKSR